MSFTQPTENVFFMDVPRLEDLCSVVIMVPPLQNSDKCPYQPHIIRCRELIFTEPDIIATPLISLERHIQIIMQQSYYKTGRLQARFKKMGFEMKKPHRVIAGEMQACLNYTITARLAPLWNRLGDLLIKGREFLLTKDKMNAINFELNVTEEQTYLVIKAHNIRCLPFKLTDLDISAPLIQEFVNNYPHGRIEEYSINRKWCHILPSMKKGQIISIHQVIPSDSPFKSYKDMKRYWKNTYGYRLPESEDGILFVQVYFKLIGEKLFTYPSCCIRACPVMYLPRADAKMITDSFLQDLVTKVPSLCGVKLRITSETQHMEPQLMDVMTMTPQCVPNLTSSTEHSQQRGAYLPSGGLSGGMTILKDNLITVPENTPHNHNLQQSSKTQQNDSCNRVGLPDDGNTLNQEQVVPQIWKTSPGTNMKRIVPVFKRVKSHSLPSANTVVSKPKSVPTFTSKGNNCNRNISEKGMEKIKSTQTMQRWPVATQSTDLEISSENVASLSPCLQAVPDTPVMKYCKAGNAKREDSKKLTIHRCAQNVKPDNWKRREDVGNTPVKKQRTKPQIQDVDVELLAKTNQLAKVNCSTLIRWLQQNGIPCRSKDKKADLVLKVQSLVK